MRSAGLSDIGLVRQVNEDGFLCEFSHNKLTFFIVADGMGGRNAGEVASSMAIDYIKKFLESHMDRCIDTDEDIKILIKDAILFANEKVYKKSILSSECVGMGTTLSLVCIVQNKLYIGHVGDSRVYLIRNNLITKLTVDHSLVEELVKSGIIKPEEANSHPQKHIVTRALGTEYDLEVDLYEFDIESGDYILLCTDGLCNQVSDSDIMEIVNDNIDVNVICQKLISMAKENGGFDNITVIVIKAELGGE